MEEKRVKDLMLSLEEYATVPAEATIRDALLSMNEAQLGLDGDRHHHRAVLVLDVRGRVIGKLSHWAILRQLKPRLLHNGDLIALARAGLTQEFIDAVTSTLSGFGSSLSLMCSEAARIKARDAMVPVAESIDEDASLSDAIQELVVSHVQSMLVTRDGEVVGILRLSDVFEEVAAAIRGEDLDGSE